MPRDETASAPARTLPEGTTLLDLVDAHPRVLAVLEQFGIRIDPWTLIALRSSITQLAEYSALRDPEELREAIERAIRD